MTSAVSPSPPSAPPPSVDISSPPPSRTTPITTDLPPTRRSRILSPADLQKRFSTCSNPREAPDPPASDPAPHLATTSISTSRHNIPSFPPAHPPKIPSPTTPTPFTPTHPSSLPYAAVRDFAYPHIHPLHYGPPPRPATPRPDPPAPHPPADGPPWSEDDDLASPLVPARSPDHYTTRAPGELWRDADYIYSDDEEWGGGARVAVGHADEEMHGRAVALFDFAQENENELPLVEGQVVWVSYRHGMGWLVAQDPKTGESGLVPEEYVRLLRDFPDGDDDYADYDEEEDRDGYAEQPLRQPVEGEHERLVHIREEQEKAIEEEQREERERAEGLGCAAFGDVAEEVNGAAKATATAKPEPEPEHELQAKAKPGPESKPGREPQPEPESKAKAKAKPAREPKPEPQPEPKPGRDSKPKPEPKPQQDPQQRRHSAAPK